MKTVQRLYLNCELTLNSRANTYFLDYFWHGSGVFLLNAVDPRQNMFRECIHRRVGCSPGRVPFKYFCLGGGGVRGCHSVRPVRIPGCFGWVPGFTKYKHPMFSSNRGDVLYFRNFL
jgi:hypothetical protein